VAVALVATVLAVPAAARRSVAQKKQIARTQFENAERMREALHGRPASERTQRDYKKVTDAFRAVYYTAPTSNKADAGVVAVAELLAEQGRRFNDEKSLRAAIAQYEFLRREYPGSRYRVGALFTIAQIYKEDLDDAAQARTTFEEFLHRYPHSESADDARAALKEMDQQAKQAKEKPKPEPEKAEAAPEKKRRPLVTGVRHWSTPDYTRVAIDLEGEVAYEAGRVANPDRVFFDLHDTRLASILMGKSFDVEDGFLRKIRVAQFQPGETRIVLELDEVAEYSSFLLPNPYRLIIDIHGKRPPQKVAKAEPPKSAPREKAVEAPKPPVETAKREADPSRKAADVKPTAEPTSAKSGQIWGTPAKAEIRPAEKKPVAEQVAKLNPPEVDEAAPPASSKSTESTKVPSPQPAPKRGKSGRKSVEAPAAREAQPAANGERSLIRALGLKIGRIVVDAGHGGHDTGTIGPNGLEEKDLVLDVALRLGKLLDNRMGAEVVYTRDDDTFIPLETRTAIANQNQADLFISVHANSSRDPSARGVETYYLNFTTSADALEVAARENAVSEKSIHELQDLVKKIALKEKIEESREFASNVQQALYTGIANKGLRNRGVKKAPFIVLIGANMPSILAEISFVSNPADAKRLKTPDYRQKIAESLYRGVSKYVGGLSGLKVASKVMRPDEHETTR
jgi:N-acetylmuramoyl-L-alanine amidase